MREQMLLDRTAVLKSLVLCEISTYHVQILAANPGLASTGTMRRYSEGFSSQARAVSLYNSSTRPRARAPRRAQQDGMYLITPKANQSRANLYPIRIEDPHRFMTFMTTSIAT